MNVQKFAGQVILSEEEYNLLLTQKEDLQKQVQDLQKKILDLEFDFKNYRDWHL